MNTTNAYKRALCLLLALLLLTLSLSACVGRGGEAPEPTQAPERARYLVAVEDEPDTVDFQCTTIHYTVAQNVFDRLVEMETDAAGRVSVMPSLAESWTVSDDGCRYAFHLRPGVRFSNGAALTASDVEYTLTRLLTHPDSCNRDIAETILGAEALANGEADRLEGFQLQGELDFTITLAQPFSAFLACLSMPGASILDRETTEAAGDRFGLDPACTVGTGSFILRSLVPGEGMLLTANSDCWKGAPRCDGLDLRFLTDPDEIRMLFEDGKLDVLDLDDLDNSMEFFLHGDIYQDRRQRVQQVGISYIALNESVAPLDNADVRRALQLALNRSVLLDAVCGGRGELENGIFPHGLYGYNPDLPALPFDPDEAARLLAGAGYPDGFDLTVTVKSSASQWELTLMRLAASMWEKAGVRVSIEALDENTFMQLRKAGRLACYTATWTADYNDPDNFISTFFGSPENTAFRSLCYPRQEIMERVRLARGITDADARLAEYRELERIIVQEDAAWIPLFSRQRDYVTSERVAGFKASWNGSVKNNYRDMELLGTAE